MVKRITPRQIKNTNRQLIYDFIYHSGKVSQQDISYALHLSRPTVTANLTELEADGLVFKNGQQDSELIGRKAVGYSVTADFHVAVGVELMREEVKMILVDLYGKKIEREVIKILYRNEESYYREICGRILGFTERFQLRPGQLLGVGIAMQGLISTDGTTVLYGAILENTGLTTSVFRKYLHCPCAFIHDPKSAAVTELWNSPELSDAVYISLSRHLGGALINGKNVLFGKHGHHMTIEHYQMNPKGRLCYCGRRGCLETVLSMQALLGEEDPESFFEAVRSGAPAEAKRWTAYLTSLAKTLHWLHLTCDLDLILGGHLAAWLQEEDIRFLYRQIRKYNPFTEEDDFLLLSKMPSHNITIGAALVYIRRFLRDIDAPRDDRDGFPD